MSHTALCRIGPPSQESDGGAAQDQEPEDHREPELVSVDKKMQRIGQRVLSHAKLSEDRARIASR